MFQISDYIVPNHFEIPNLVVETTDLGGDGDCLIRCFREALRGSVTVEPSEDIYVALSLPQGTYLEDTHLSMLASSYSATVFVLRIHGDSAVIQHYRPADPVHSICLVNYHPHHFVLADFQVDNEPIAAVLEFPANLNPEWNLVLDGEERVFRSILSQAGDFLQSDVEEKTLLAASVVVPTADIAVLYSYLLDTNLMAVHDLATAMDMYYQCHHVLLDFLKTCQEEHKLPPRPFFKAYYKFRHNIFSALCLISMGLIPSSLGTDMEIKKWVPLSNKTPDFVTEDETKIVLWEFTVGNNYESVDFLKGGGNFDLKYSQECSLIEKASGKTATVKVVPCVLDINNADEVLSLLGLEITKESRSLFLDFMNIANSGRSQISHSYTASMVATDKIQEPNLYLELAFDREPIPKIQLFDAEFLSKLVASNSVLIARATSLSLQSSKKHFLGYDVDNHRFFFLVNLHGMSMDWWVSTLRSKHLSEILSNMRYYSNSKEVSKDRVKGTVPVMSSSKESPYKAIRWSADSYVEEVYNSRTAIYNPGYGEPEAMDDSSLLERFVSDKVAFPAHYMSDLVNMDSFKMLEYDGESMLANCRVTLDGLTHVIEQFSDAYKMANSDFTFRPKQTFMVPLATEPMQHVGLDQLPNHMFQLYIEKGLGKYTRTVCKKAAQSDFMKPDTVVFTEAVRASLEDYQFASAAYHSKLVEIGKPGHTAWKDCTEEERRLLEPSKMAMIKKSRAYKSSLKMGRGTISPRMVSLRCSKNSVTRQHYDAEMEHFGNRGSYGVGYPSAAVSEEAGAYFHGLSRRLFETEFHHNTFPELYGRHRSVSPQLLTDIKNRYTERWDLFSDRFFKGTLCQQLTFLASNLANFLLSESVKNHNSTRLKVDNLGFSDFVVICRGGPKIYKNQTSKLFRAMFFIDSQDLKMSGYQENPTFEVIKTQGRYMVVTPWSTIRQDILFDMLSLPYTTFNFLFSSYTRTYPNFDMPVPELLSLPVILSLHNRRKTESLMHNCRYLVVNLLGENANLAGIIKGFATFNYTYLDCWLKNRIRDGYLDFAKSLMTLREAKRGNIESLLDSHQVTDLWFGKPITTADQLTLFIYITYMMSKAPVNGSIEQSLNLWEVLEDVVTFDRLHGDVEGMKDYSLRSNVLSFNAEDYADDFKYDPVFCQFQGHYLSGYLSNLTNRSDLECVWNRIEQEDLGVIANSNGLRGWDRTNFFGKKGYEVVYKDIEASTRGDELENMFLNYLKSDPITSANTISADRNSLIDSEGFDKLLFHIVHKIQRGGNREIYCMDLNTKRKQYPIEKFLKHVCKMIPNEFISIPSNKRHSMIHSDFYEKPIGPWVKSVKRWVLDCRRWAPHSVFQKYVHFIKGLSPILPAGFINHFYKFAEGMMVKKFVTREHVLKKMRNNIRFQEFEHLFHQRSDVPDAYEFVVKFSFVMGIFNYLSTALHAANQLVASEVIRLKCLQDGLGLVVLDPKCHSDDSVVTSYHEDPKSIRLTVMMYDWLLKSSNHMLSVKKSQINNNVYLEFLSVLYLFDRLLPVYPKFVSTMPFKPSDNGYSSDLSFCVTQGLELMSQGGSFEECFLICKTTERFIQTQYMIDVSPELPPQLLGQFDSHPIELVYLGGLSDLVRWYKFDNDKFWRTYNHLWANNILDQTKGQFQLEWDMGAKLLPGQLSSMGKYSALLDKLGASDSWTVSNCKLGNGKLNLLWYYHKLKDRKFRSTLMDEPVARRYSRIIGSARYRQLRTARGLVSVGMMSVLMSHVPNIKGPMVIDAQLEQIMDFFYSLISDFYDSIEGSTLGEVTPSGMKEKPVLLIKETHPLSSLQISYSEYVSYKKEPNFYKLLGKRQNPARQVKKVDDYLRLNGLDPEVLGTEALSLVSRRILSHSETQMRFVTTTAGGSRIIKNMQALIKLLSYNTFTHKKIEIKNHAAASIDWTKKSLVGAMPQAAVDYVRNYWVCRQLVEYGIQDLDIYHNNPLLLEKDLVKSLSAEWKLILLSALEGENKPLADLAYWCYWEQEQVKLGYRWFGHGVCVLSTPEVILRITCDNGVLQKMEVDTNYLGQFSNSTSWFLHNYFNHSGMSVEMSLSAFAEPDAYYLGYSSATQTYGYHRATMFDYVVQPQQKSSGLMPAFANQTVPRKRVYNHYLYGHDMEFYVDFFVPTEEPTAVGFKGVFDLDKIKEHRKSQALKKFITDIAIDTGEMIKVDKTELANNIGDSTWYRMVFNSQQFQNLVTRAESDETLVNSIMEWKKTHPKFGFPSMEELDMLLKGGRTAPFPKRIMEALLRLGRSNMPETDFLSLIAILASMTNEERMSYMMNNFSYLSSDLRADALVMSVRSTRIYSSSKMLGREFFKVLLPLVDSIRELLDTNAVSSMSLTRLVKGLNLGLNKQYRPSQAFEVLFCQLLFVNFGATSCLSKETKYQKWFMTVLDELWDDGLGPSLNRSSSSDLILRSIEFNVEKSVFLEWVVDLLDCLFYLNLKNVFKIKYHMESRAILGEGSLIASSISSVRATMVRMKSNPAQRHITYETEGKTYRLPLQTEQIVGNCRSPLQFFDREGANEYLLGYKDEEDEDLVPYCDLRPDDEVEDFAYVTAPFINFQSVVLLRGTARSVFVHGFDVSRDIKDVWGHARYFRAKRRNVSLVQRIQSEYECLVYFGKKLKKLVVHGFEELSQEDFWKFTQKSPYTSDSIMVGKQKRDKWEVFTGTMSNATYESIENYFRRMTVHSVLEDAKDLGSKFHQVISDHYISPVLEQERSKMASVVEKMNIYKEEGREDEMIESTEFSLIDTIQEVANEEAIMSTSGNKEYIVSVGKIYNYQEQAKLVTDLVFKSEVNAFFPEYVDRLFNAEVRISKKTKKRLRNYIDGQLRLMQRELKPKYKKLAVLVESILTLCVECNFRQNETLDFVSLIDDIFDADLDLEDEQDNMADYLPGDGSVSISFDFEKLFG